MVSNPNLKADDLQAELGQGLVEYALILVLVALIVIIGLALFGDAVLDLYEFASTELLNAFSGGATP